jgi:hypothetical protein
MDLLAFAGNVVTVMLGSGAAFSLLHLYTERRKRTDEVGFLATQLAVQFEGYAIECADKVSDNDTAWGSDGAAGENIRSIPQFAPLPISDAYKLLKRGLVDEMLQLPQDILMAQKSASFTGDVGDEDEYIKEVRDSTLRIGSQAANMALKLRQKYSLPERLLVYNEWDIRKYFGDELAKIQQEQEARRLENQRLWNMAASLPIVSSQQ